MMSLFSRVTCVENFASDSSERSNSVRREAREAFVVAEIEPGELDTLGFHQAEPQITEMIVVRGRDGKSQHVPLRRESLSYCQARLSTIFS
jgi:hypothetical protein